MVSQQRQGGRVCTGDQPLAIEQQHAGRQRREDGVKLTSLHVTGGDILLQDHKADLKLAIESAYSISMPAK